jgi:flagella basal body P-ring formation protein FlgA
LRAESFAGLVLAIVASLAPATPSGAQPSVDAAVAAATQAVREAFGGNADVTITAPVLSMVPDAGPIVKAVPEPASRTGGLVRFVLYGAADTAARRVGRLTGEVRVVAPHLRTKQAVAAGTAMTPDLVEDVRADIGRQRLVPLPSMAQASATTTRAAMRAGDVVTPVVLVTRPMVSSGDEVVTVARVGALEVRGRAIAAQSGDLGETVIVVNPDSRKRLRGRVVAEDVVEVRHGS